MREYYMNAARCVDLEYEISCEYFDAGQTGEGLPACLIIYGGDYSIGYYEKEKGAVLHEPERCGYWYLLFKKVEPEFKKIFDRFNNN